LIGLDHKEGAIKKPLIRWAGGKRSIVSTLISFLPKKYGSYFEPMVGGGALFFAICPDKAVIADINPELINFYSVIKHRPHEFLRAIEKLRALKTTYESFRKSSPSHSLERAVRFFYLIRLSWNGIYRVNRKGRFNVPFGRRRPKTLVTREAIEATSKTLGRARLMCGDFENTTADIKADDLVYLDPPYPKGAETKNGFDRYHETRFNLEDHRRLATYAEKLADKGAHVLISEAGSEELVAFYNKRFKVQLVKSRSLIAADSEFRGKVCEAIITSYSPKES
jgi:DNA adenine methylase